MDTLINVLTRETILSESNVGLVINTIHFINFGHCRDHFVFFLLRRPRLEFLSLSVIRNEREETGLMCLLSPYSSLLTQ